MIGLVATFSFYNPRYRRHFDILSCSDINKSRHWSVDKSHWYTMDNLVCPICGKQFNHKKKFSDHRRVHDITVFNCEECGLDVTGLKSMVAHKAVHKKIECKTCGISLKANTLTSHKAICMEAIFKS